MLDRALSRTFANLSTLILVAFVVTIPIHLVHAYVFKDELAVQEIGPEIASFPEGRQVRGVARADLGAERKFLFVALGVELLALPLVLRAARRVMDVDEEGGVPTVLDAWRRPGRGGSPEPGPVLAAGAVGAVAGLIVWSIGDRV